MELEAFDGEFALVVERFDRIERPGRPVRRLHQEDMCQALGLPRSLKYQADGGPSARDVASLLGRVIGSPRLERARRQFAESVLFNWLTAGTDAHAKNFALVHARGSVALAPLYDLMSAALVTDGQEAFYHGKLAMKLGGQYGIRRIGWREVEKAATDLAVDPGWFVGRAKEMREAIPAAFAEAIAEAEPVIDPLMRRRFVDGITGLVARLAQP